MARSALYRTLGTATCVVLLALAAVQGRARSADADAGSTSSAQARERVAYVAVVESKTLRPVPDLGPDAFVIREDGNRREVLRAARATSPMAVAVIVDNSQAMAPAINDLRKALAGFATMMAALGPTAVFTVADRPTILQEYTTSPEDLQNAANRLFHAPDSGATLLDTIADVSRGLARREADRAAIVVITGEHTEFGNLHYSDVLERLRDSGAMMYVVTLVNPRGSMASDEARNRATVLDRGPRESGGIRVDVLTSMAFDTQLRAFADILKSQYRVTYSRPESLLQPERFQVSAAKPGLEAYGAPARGQEKK